LIAGDDIAAMDPMGPDFIHLVAEAMKLAFADREAFYGDPNFVDVPMATLLSPAYNAARRALIGDAASMEFRPGFPDGRAAHTDYAAAIRRAQEMAAAAGSGEPTVSRLGAAGGDTCHVDVIDSAGNMVSATPSAGWLQSSPAIPELGFCLGTRCQMFWLDESLPNGLQPGKRPRTTLSPALLLRDGKAWMSFGTPGGEQQDQWQSIMLLRMLHNGMNIQEAIDAPSFHSEHWISSFWPRGAKPGKLVIEGRYAPEVLAALKARGHQADIILLDRHAPPALAIDGV
jgi:gamma-glutamyltranspeptidase/glutathione hydrolase